MDTEYPNSDVKKRNEVKVKKEKGKNLDCREKSERLTEIKNNDNKRPEIIPINERVDGLPFRLYKEIEGLL